MFLIGALRVLWGLSLIPVIVECRTLDFGGYISDKTILNSTDSVYEVRKDIIIEKDASLIIKPGVELRFAPGVGIYVHRDGILEAKGTEYQKIRFTRLVESWSELEDFASGWPDVRLVDGDSIVEGRLQILYKEKWRSVCTNSKNWTQEALNVMCRQLGFSGGELYHWFPRNNDSSQLMYEDPHCGGNESSLFHCPNWQARQLGSGVCDFHHDIGIRCDKHLSTQSSSNWRGIKYLYSKFQEKKPIENKVNRQISLSSLEHVRIMYAGRDAYGNAVPAIEIYGLPPVLSNVEIKNSAFDAVHVFYPSDAFAFKDSIITNNRGHGVFINSSVSQITFSGVNIEENGGNGIHFVHHENFGTAPSFCKSASFGEEQIYPVRRSHVQERNQFSKNCDQVFEVASRTGQVLTVNFMGFSTDINDPKRASHIDVYDGIRLLASVPILNNTYPQSITSSKQKLHLKYRTVNGQDVSFVVEILANHGRAYDLNVTDCRISSNHGKGIYIEGQRSGILVNSSVLSKNGHVAGLDISTGCGDVVVNNSIISNNNGDGINITYSGGFIHIDQSSIGSNEGRGISFWFNETSNYIALNHTVHITASEVVNNSLYGILVGNQCMSNSFWNISLNSIRRNKDCGISIDSCWSSKKDAAQSIILVTHNQFLESDHFSLKVSPILHTHLLVEHNEFKKHERGVIFINGLDDDEYAAIPVKAEIQHNYFESNSGKFVVNIGVCQGTLVQELFFYRNELVGNSIKEPFPSLNPRSRVAAVVVVSSENTYIIRNRFDNLDSTYELGSHMEKHHIVVNASYNYWGYPNNVRKVYERIFDRKDRYNLARIEFLPFLTVPTDLDSTTAVSDNHERDKIIPFQTGSEIGGEVPGSLFLPKDTYIVKRDIYVRPGNGRLQIEPGSTFKFDQAIGMMVQGVLLSESSSNFNAITYTLNNDNNNRIQEETNIRLSGPTEGLLEVLIDGNWGSVCDYGWDIVDASIACNQMGLVLHPEDWLLEQSEFEHGWSTFPIVISNLQCTLQDTDITKCRAERDFENSCFTKVGLRCYHPSWSGLRLGMAAEESRLKNVIIESAGLLDYTTNSFKPALQIDFNKHYLEHLKITDNTDSGIGIMWNEMFSPQSRQIIDSQILSNRHHGIVVHSQGLKIHQCELKSNAGTGIFYNPMFSKLEQRDLISWINLEERKKVIKVPDDLQGNITLNHDEYRYLVFTKKVVDKSFNIITTNGRSIGIVVLNPFGSTSSENMTIYGRLQRDIDVTTWDLRDNLTAFPLQTPGFGVIVDYFSGQNPSGQGIFYIASVDGQRNKAPWETHPQIHIDSVNIRDCKRGISSHHFNRDVSHQEDHFHRYTNETILITNTVISNSKSEAIFVWTPFWDPVMKNLAEINYTIINSTIHSNGKGLLQYSRDIRNSNNLFHWTINNTVFENNAGGIDIRLPYVWQYNENFTHSFSMNNCSLTRNRKFEFSISGHFARVNMTKNKFEENVCKKGILSFSGMEKELLIEENVISENSAIFGVEFNLQSHANKFGLVPAYFRRNSVTNNKDIGLSTRLGYEPTSYGLAIRGVQLVNINRNILVNINMQFELLTGVLTGSVDNKINVGYNWWGSDDPLRIQERIFDFDDWNGYAIADINPYLGFRDMDAGALPFNSTEQALIKVGRLSGRLYHNYRLKYRYEPYVITSDLTVMPGATLTIEPGVTMEFQPSVGILVLGDILARGTPEKPIIMKPSRSFDEKRFRRQADLLKSRLCIDEKCTDKLSDGFLEIYNSTTEQWVPVCDRRFTERNAQVVCKELGYNILNVYFSFGPRLEMGPTQTTRIRSWPHPLECTGTEKSLSDCEYRLNGYIDNYKCHHDGDFVYIYCGQEILPEFEEHWGGIRFSIASFETTDSPLNRPTLNYIPRDLSELEYVHIRGAGVLHNEKSSALQLVQREITLDFVNISESASHALEVIGVSGNLAFNELSIKNNLGIGINILTLTGESTSEASKLGYDPLRAVDIPYGIFGMVDICDTNKEMTIEDRILLYYKYDNQPVDCVKIFNSHHSGKQIGFRLLQFNLFNGTIYAAQPDNIKVYDGDVFNETSPVLATIGWHIGSDSATNFYVSSDDTLSVLLHTIGGSGDHGFIAEVITVPISHLKTQDSVHNISYSEISDNGQEGFVYRSAGEITPAITLRYSRFNNNGKELFGNFTSGESAVALDVQNAKAFYFYNNLVMRNQGGLSIKVDSHTAVLGIHAIIVNNLFTENRNKEVLSLQGRKSGTFQLVNAFHNYFVRNYAKYENTMLVSQVVSNLTENMAYNNTGKHLLHVQGFERVPLSFQICVKNWFWRNVATDYWDKSTIIASKAGQKFSYNYLVNPDNDFELAARNRSIFSTTDSSIYATWNWWGFSEKAAISGRIKDSLDSEELLSVTYEPFLHDNTSVLSGKCAGGWTKIGDTCFLYVGGVMTFAEAKRFCELDNASMPYVKTKHNELMDFVREQQHYYQHYSDRFWIQSLDIPPRECAVLVNRKVVKHSCGEYFPFLCERDPEITVSASLWFMEPLTIAFLSISALSLVFVAMCVGFWLCKSRQRYREKLERRNSIRASIRSNRSLTGFSELGYKRRMERAFEAQSTPKTPQMKLNGSIDSVEKSASRFSCSMDDSYENTLGDTSASRVANGDFSPFVRNYHHDAAHENGTANLMVHPTFDLTYENQCFVDRSASRNSQEISRDWSSSTGSTLDMKRSLENKEQNYNVRSFNHNTPSPPLTIESNGGSSHSSSRQPPLETAM